MTRYRPECDRECHAMGRTSPRLARMSPRPVCRALGGAAEYTTGRNAMLRQAVRCAAVAGLAMTTGSALAVAAEGAPPPAVNATALTAGGAPSRAAGCHGTINPPNEVDVCSFRLPSARVFTFRLHGSTPGFDPAMTIVAGGKTFRVNNHGPNVDEVFKLRVLRPPVNARVFIGSAFRRTVGNFVLTVTP